MNRGATWWVGLALLLAAMALALSPMPHEQLDWHPVQALTQPWRAWSAVAVHWTAWHLVANLIGCVVVAVFGVAASVPPRATLAWFLAWPLAHLALLAQPALSSYGGLSGVLHAGVAIAAFQLLRRERGSRRAVGAAVLLGLAVKLALETPWVAPTRDLAGWDFPVAPIAHVTGALAGLLCAWLVDLVAARATP